MPSFDGLLIVVAVAFAVPLVLEILAGIIIGPSVLGIVHVDQAISVISVIGLAFLLFLAGLEIDFTKLRGQLLRLTLVGFVASFAIAVLVSLLLKATGLIETPLLVAIILCATSLGVLIPVLKDAGQISSTFGQLIIAAGTIADFGAVILLSIFFSGEGGVGSTLLLIGSLVLLAIVVFIAVQSAERSSLLRQDPVRLQDTTAQIRVRGAVVLLVGFAAIADSLGLESILGAFMAGAILSLLDRDEQMTHPEFRRKLEAVGFGIFIPVFFVSSGVNYDLDALLSSASNVLMVPIFLGALIAARGLPALAYRRVLDNRQTAIAGLMQATSLPFIVAAVAIGEDLDLVSAAEGAALIGAGLLSVLLFPAIGLGLVKRGGPEHEPEPASDALMAM